MHTSSDSPAFQKNDKKIIHGWAMFDWANSSYALVITSAIFPAYFNAVVKPENFTFLGIPVSETSLFAYSLSAAYLLIAAALPLLTGMADYGGRKMYFMKWFTTIGSLACISLFFFEGLGANETSVGLFSNMSIGVFGFMLAAIGFAGGQVFYNSYLPDIVTEDKFDSISARGFSYGYVGSVILLVANLLVIAFHESLGLEEQTATQIAFIAVGLWWIGFAQVAFNRLPKDRRQKRVPGILSKGYKEIQKVWRELQHLPNTKRFLISFFFYAAGVQTVMYLATTFATDELKMDTQKMIITVLIIQFVAIAGAHLFAKLSEARGNKISLIIMLVIWIGVCTAAYFVYSEQAFYAIAGVVGLVMGGIQSLSRSTYSKLIPADTKDTASFFSFFDVVEKTAIVIGTFSFGYIDQLMGGMRNSVLALIVFFLIGIGILLTVKIKAADSL